MTEISPTGIKDFWTSPRPSTRGGKTWDSRPPSRMESCDNAKNPEKYGSRFCFCWEYSKPASREFCERCRYWKEKPE